MELAAFQHGPVPMGDVPPRMLVGENADAIVVRIDGPATMAIGPNFSALCEHYRDDRHRPIFVDLSRCEWLDSTFAGCLLSQSVRSRSDQAASFALVAASPGCRDALDKLGVTEMLLDESATVPSHITFEPVTPETFSPDRLAQTVVDAHDRLADVNEANQRTFGTIAAAFRADLERKKNQTH